MVRSIKGKHPNYFEAIIQLRDCEDEVAYFVRGEALKAEVPIVKEKKVKGGVDLYLVDNRFARALGRKLQDRFGGEVKITASLWGRKDGKEVYRTTVLFRCSGIVQGDLVEYKGEEFRVKLVTEKDLMLQELKTGRKEHVRFKDLDRVKKVEK